MKKLIDKILSSNKVEKIIEKLYNKYTKIIKKLLTRYNLKNDLKQGKIYTIIVLIIILLLIMVLFTFFSIALNSLIGLNFILTIFKSILFLLKCSYLIFKNKKDLIIKYINNLLSKEKVKIKELKLENIPTFEYSILVDIENTILKINTLNIEGKQKEELLNELKNITLLLKINDNTFQDEITNLKYKQDICKQLTNVLYKIKEIETKSIQRINLDVNKEIIIEEINKSKKLIKRID